MADRALEAAAQALLAETRRENPDDLPIHWSYWADEARACVSAYLDALLSELPEEAVIATCASFVLDQDHAVAAMKRLGEGASPDDEVWLVSTIARAFLLSLRSSSRGANG